MRSKWQKKKKKREARAKPRNVDDSGRNRPPKSEERELGKRGEPRKGSAAQRAEQIGDLQSWPPALQPLGL